MTSSRPRRPSSPSHGAHPAPDRDWMTCPVCGHAFDPGARRDAVYCTDCGRHFRPGASLDETVTLDPVPSRRLPVETDSLFESPASTGGSSCAGSGIHGAVDPVRAGGGAGGKAMGDSLTPSTRSLSKLGGCVSPHPVDEDLEAIPFGDYDILTEVARGGMGVVYRARHRMLKRVVALKVLREGDAASEEDILRFMQEAKAAASLQHPNIVPIHEMNVHKGQPYFTMDYIEGTPLDHRIERGPLTPHDACKILGTVAEAIHYAHTEGIIHRDIKPANIILDRHERPMITDFGLAVNLSHDARSERMTRTGAVMGTIPYIPPEQAAGQLERIGPRSDVYSLGALLYEMLTGVPPFSGQTQFELLQHVIHHEPRPPRRLNPRIHPDAETICLKCLNKDPQRRYESAAALATDCAAFLQGELIQARPATLRYRVWRYTARHWAISLLSAVTVLSLCALLIHSHLARGETQQLKEELILTRVEHQKVEKERRLTQQELQRNWRQEFSLFPDGQFRSVLNKRHALLYRTAWIDEDHAFPRDEEQALLLHAPPDRDTRRASLGIPIPLPLDFRIRARVRVPVTQPGQLDLFLGAQRDWLPGPRSLRCSLGVEGTPGVRLSRDETTLLETGTFSLQPGSLYEIEVVRMIEPNELRIRINGTEILHSEGAMGTGASADVYFGMGAFRGDVEILDLDVHIMGLSREMIRSLLEVADSLSLQGEATLAQELYKRVLREDTRRDIHLRAYTGWVRTLQHQRHLDVDQVCAELFQEIQLRGGRRIEPGEMLYVAGLLHQDREVGVAVSSFGQAVQAAVPGLSQLFTSETPLVIGPFPAPGGLSDVFPPEADPFDPDAAYETANGILRWGAIADADNNGEPVFFNVFNESHVTRYVFRRYRSDREQDVYIFTGTDDGMTLWVNGQKRMEKDVRRSVVPNSESTRIRFREGENTLLLKIHNIDGNSGFSLQIVPRDIPPARLGAYGLLARLEGALLLLRIGQVEDAVPLLVRMQRDDSLRLLGQRFPREVQARGIVAQALTQVDALLGDPGRVETAWSVLEALRILDRESNKDFALRYHRLAMDQIGRGQLREADTTLQQAIALVPDWHLPWFDRARLLHQRGLSDEGEAAFAAAMTAMPTSLDLHLSIARWHLQPEAGAADPRKALASAQVGIQLSERKSPEALTLAAQAFLGLGQEKEAAALLDEALALEETPERRALRIRIDTRPAFFHDAPVLRVLDE